MRKIAFIITSFFLNGLLHAQPNEQQEYYSSIDFSKTGTELKAALSHLITQTHSKQLTYKQIWEVTKITDIDPTNNHKVILLYGWPNGTSSDHRKAYNRDKSNNGPASNQWNREHTFAKSLGRPNLGTEGPGADAHHLRACDVEWNAMRGNQKFAEGSGFSKNTTGGWYPGEEWKGDVARMMMYMYVRYGTQCLPASVGVGSTTQTPDGMIDLFLKWNAEDPVSPIEIKRNQYHADKKNKFAQGNRNPFIDNPRIATVIWGGPEAEDRWNTNLSTSKTQDIKFSIYPNPTYDRKIYIQSTTNIELIQVFSLNGIKIKSIEKPKKENNSNYNINHLPQGAYIIKANAGNKSGSQKIIVR